MLSYFGECACEERPSVATAVKLHPHVAFVRDAMHVANFADVLQFI